MGIGRLPNIGFLKHQFFIKFVESNPKGHERILDTVSDIAILILESVGKR
jgi:hypothetical protein